MHYLYLEKNCLCTRKKLQTPPCSEGEMEAESGGGNVWRNHGGSAVEPAGSQHGSETL